MKYAKTTKVSIENSQIEEQKKLAKEFIEKTRKLEKKSIYNLKLFNGIKKPNKNKEPIFELSEVYQSINKIICRNSANMNEIRDKSVSLIITSPPYNIDKDYGNDYKDNSNLTDYLNYLDEVWFECLRILRPGGRLCVNIANIGRSPYLPLTSYFFKRICGLGFLPRGQIIWNKKASVGNSTAWGSWQSASNPTLRDIHEYILIFSKSTNQLKQAKDSNLSDITRDEFLEYTKSIWTFQTEKPKRVGHPAPFPEELAYRLLKLYSYPGDLIVDPFLGSGTTCKVAKDNNRKYFGYDINPDYVEVAKERLKGDE